ncbi:sugar-binding transcriptional regulator [Bifidobacterium catulorum]|uniref:Transcriptional regulator n=1 Tax=Bifidobacterium catulorum TaxID=1630173 RepID=A0A2U2MVC4_9BIFI|nr:sugar-binding domain-containing protein [Bifidobacterium catulorum]PWG60807.1 transcriptional regulator [Bifidobacterium catulorum]
MNNLRQTGRIRNGEATKSRRNARYRLADVAELYWMQDMTVAAIGTKLGISRSTVSRLLAQARERNIIEFVINREEDSTQELRDRLRDLFHIHVTVSNTSDTADADIRRFLVGQDTARLLSRLARPNMTIGVAWGRTMESVSLHLTQQDAHGIQIVQLHGFGDSYLYGESYVTKVLNRFGESLNARVHLFPVPAIFDSEAAHNLMWQERSVRRILALRRTLDLTVASLGAPQGVTPSALFTPGVLQQSDIDELHNEHVVGNFASTFFRQDGSTGGISVNNRSTGMSRQELMRVPIRLFTVADPSKAKALRVALNAGFATHLVVDRATARQLLLMQHL